MTFWNSTNILTINDGSQPDDGTGDNIRAAFIKVNENFSNISIQLSGVNQDWLNANVQNNTNLNYANIANLFVANSTGTTSNFTGNTYSGNIVANTGLYSSGYTYLTGNTYVSSNILPTSAGTINLGSPAFPFGNLYVQTTVSTTQVTNSTNAGLFLIHANTTQTDTQDVGIFGNISNDYNQSNTYAFFGHQYATNNFIYKITPTNATLGNNIVVGGVYGNVQFGSLFLSNTTPTTGNTSGALIVGGGVGIGGDINAVGNLTIGGNAYANGYQVLTTNSPGLSQYSGSAISQLVITGSNQSTNTVTGALVLSYGGIGLAGSLNAGGNVTAVGLVGPLYGTVQTQTQNNIFYANSLVSVGTLNQLQVATSIGTPSIVVSGAGVNGFPIIVSTGGASISGNLYNNQGSITSTGNITTSVGWFVGNISSPQINTLNTTVATIQSTDSAFQAYANANIGTLYLGNISTNANLGTLTLNHNTLQANVGAFEIYANANIGAFQTYANANIGTLYLGNISTQANLGLYQTTTNQTLTTLQTEINSLVTNANANTAAYLTTYSGTISASGLLPSANVSNNIGSTSLWWNNIYGVAIQAQYADLAEIYVADAEYVAGTVVIFGGDQEITVTDMIGNPRVAGVISTNPAYLMNAGELSGLPVALRGRVPVQVIGPVVKGDSLVTSSILGYAMSIGTATSFGQAVFAKSLVTDDGLGQRIIEAVII